MPSPRTRLCAALALVPLLAACGSSTGSTFDLTTDGGGAATGAMDGGVVLVGDASVAPVSPQSACATDHAGAALGESYLVFVMDRSDSMAADTKWASCGGALKDFFADPSTAGIEASLGWLPQVATGTTSTSADPSFLCTSTSYATPDVALTALPSTAFAAAISAQTLEFGTPTLAALQGAGQQAQTIATAHPHAQVVIVLATDGLPYGCTGDSVSTVSSAAGMLAAEGIRTFVIGVGGATGNLDAIASGGGTGKAFVVPTGNATVTAQSFLSAVQSVAGSILSCSFPIPTPPGGEQISFDGVNVVYTSSAGVSTTLPYSATCASPNGWHYDDASAPTKVALCPQACASAQGDKGADLDVVFGCATEGGPVK